MGAPSPFEGEVVRGGDEGGRGALFPGGAGRPPCMATGASDSRHLRTIGIQAYGVAPSIVSRPEGGAPHIAHGPDERKSIKWLVPGADYFRDVVRSLVL